MKKKWFSVLMLGFASVCVKAQTEGYNYFGNLDTVKKSGFYNIALTPQINAHLKTDFSDIRIVNDSGKWVPHVFRVPTSERAVEVLIQNMTVVKKENDLSATLCIIKNSDSAISSIRINIRNTQVERFCTLAGSDDLNNWFIINDSVLLKPEPGDEKYQSFFHLNFPPATYKYFKLLINNKGKEPLNIISVYSNRGLPNFKEFKIPQYLPFENPQIAIAQRDSGSISYVKLTQNQAYHFDILTLRPMGAKYFYRNVEVHIPADSHHSFAHPGPLVSSFTISNNSTLQFRITLSNARVFYLFIHNEDNPPIKLNEVKTYSTHSIITTYLEEGHKYRLLLSNQNATAPNYDLGKFEPGFKDDIPYLQVNKIEELEKKISEIQPAAKNNKWILWVAIAIAIIILLFFTQKMIKEIDKRKSA